MEYIFISLSIFTLFETCESIVTTKRSIFQNSNRIFKQTNLDTKFSIPVGYKKEHRPTLSQDEPTDVAFDIHVEAINPIKAADMDFRMDMTLSQRWVDMRLNFSSDWFHDDKDFFILPLEFTEQIWHPDPYIVNAKSTDVGQLTQKLITIYNFKNRTVHYVANLFATVACAMNYKFYPFDHQVCPMFMESFSYDKSQVKYVWSNFDAFTINPKLRMLQFQVTRPLHYHEASVHRYLEAKNFSQLIACFRFDRLLGNHLIQTFAPCSLVVCLSWFSFWLELNALSARMSLVVTSILTLVTQFVGLKADLPPVAYIKAVDIWMAGCMVWVFGALGEYVLVKVLYSVLEDVKFIHAENLRQGQLNKLSFATINASGDCQAPDVHKEDIGNGDRNTGSQSITPLQSRRRRTNPSLIRPTTSLSGIEHSDSIFRSRSASLNSMYLEKTVGRVHIPLQWIDGKTGKAVLLWKRIDNVCKWLFPLTFCIFCGVYWTVLYLHNRANLVQPFDVSVNLNRTACLM